MIRSWIKRQRDELGPCSKFRGKIPKRQVTTQKLNRIAVAIGLCNKFDFFSTYAFANAEST